MTVKSLHVITEMEFLSFSLEPLFIFHSFEYSFEMALIVLSVFVWRTLILQLYLIAHQKHIPQGIKYSQEKEGKRVLKYQFQSFSEKYLNSNLHKTSFINDRQEIIIIIRKQNASKTKLPKSYVYCILRLIFLVMLAIVFSRCFAAIFF